MEAGKGKSRDFRLSQLSLSHIGRYTRLLRRKEKVQREYPRLPDWDWQDAVGGSQCRMTDYKEPFRPLWDSWRTT